MHSSPDSRTSMIFFGVFLINLEETHDSNAPQRHRERDVRERQREICVCEREREGGEATIPSNSYNF